MISEKEFIQYVNRGINRDRIQAIKKYAGRTILDVCCGSGAYVLKLDRDYDIRGTDICWYPTWNERPELFSVTSAKSLDYEDNSFDTIFSFETLEHLPEPKIALQEYYRVTRNNIIVTVPNCELSEGMKKSKLLYSHWEDRTHINFFTLETIEKIIEEAGFNVEHSYYINEIFLHHILAESLNVSGGIFYRIIRKFMSINQKKRYWLTCLVVARKKSSNTKSKT